jgi:hypothetical protein
MLTDRQLADITSDVTAVLGSERGVSPNERLLARHARYLLDEVARLRQWDQDRWLLEKWKEQNGA